MPPSFVIWTLQRTGGTALTSALAISTANSEIKHEPFNSDRDFSYVTKAFKEGEISHSANLIDNLLDSGVSFKHCMEIHSLKFNNMLLEAFVSRPNYRHIILMRDDETHRILSLYLARQTEVWGKWKVNKGGYDKIISGKQALDPFPIKEMLSHSKKCLEYRAWIQNQFEVRNLSYLLTTFETLYEGQTRTRIENLKKVFEFVGAPFIVEDKRVYNCIFSSKQGSEKLFKYVPNLEEAAKSVSEFIKNKKST